MWQYNNELYHYGVLGMKWGRRKDNRKASSRKIRKQAEKDAKEFARAKMFYGNGAGTRRKLIKATVEQRSKDPEYKREFENSLNNQDMSKHAKKAKTERVVADAKTNTAKTARGLMNAATGNIGRASAAAAGLYMVARFTGTDKKVATFVKTNAARGARAVSRMIYNARHMRG